MQEKYKQRSTAAVERIKASGLEPDLQDLLVELVENARIATNGLSPEEKIQTMSENQFSMAVLLAQSIIATLSSQRGGGGGSEGAASWREVVVKCRRELLAAVLWALLVLLFRPQLSDALLRVMGGGG